MRVTLAGITGCSGIGKLPSSTAETITAAYARISRSPLPVGDLRRKAARDVESSRAFNQKIIHHLGHRSVSEHAVFNFDITGISRLAVETIERSRLASYTEKSQRYVRLGEDFFIPEEARDLELSKEFAALCKRQHKRYVHLESELRRHVSRSRAKEDARYVLGLATTTQLGLTINARSLGAMVGRLYNSDLAECRHIARAIGCLVRRATPSLLTGPEEKDNYGNAFENERESLEDSPDETPRLLWHTSEANMILASAITFENRSSQFALSSSSLEGILEAAGQRYKERFNSLPRSFETIRFAFELIVSSSCFAQLKRHRMATLYAQPYDPSLGTSIPPTIGDAGLTSMVEEAAKDSEEMNSKLSGTSFGAAAYPLINAHRRRVLLVINARSFGNLAALRLDRHAQWDIRAATAAMVGLLYDKVPTVARAMGLPEV